MKKKEKNETIYQEQKKKIWKDIPRTKKKGKIEKIYKKKLPKKKLIIYLSKYQTKEKKKKIKKGTKKSIAARYI